MSKANKSRYLIPAFVISTWKFDCENWRNFVGTVEYWYSCRTDTMTKNYMFFEKERMNLLGKTDTFEYNMNISLKTRSMRVIYSVFWQRKQMRSIVWKSLGKLLNVGSLNRFLTRMECILSIKKKPVQSSGQGKYLYNIIINSAKTDR